MKTISAILLLALASGAVFAFGGPGNSRRMNEFSPCYSMMMNTMQPGSVGLNQQLVSPQERMAFRADIQSAKSYQDCSEIRDKHRAIMESRADKAGVTLPKPRRDVCAVLANLR